MGLKSLKPRVATLDPRRVKTATVRDSRNLSTYEWQQTRLRILRDAKGLCQCADCKAAGRVRLAHEVDHVVPVWEGGSEGDANLQAINRECHAIKTAREAERRAGLTRGQGHSSQPSKL